MEVTFSRRPFTDVAQRDFIVALVSGGHGPPHCMTKTAANIAGQRIKAIVTSGEKNRELPTLQRISLV